MPKLLNFTFLEGRYFLDCHNAELKDPPNIFFSSSELHRWAVVGSLQVGSIQHHA